MVMCFHFSWVNNNSSGITGHRVGVCLTFKDIGELIFFFFFQIEFTLFFEIFLFSYFYDDIS